ncbi:MAG: TIGR01777 family oxidoreductase [Puniceicoccaceae bacterium]
MKANAPTKNENPQSWRIAITGGTGMIGRAVGRELGRLGHEVVVVSRSGRGGTVFWDPEEQRFEAEKLEGCRAVIHLSGEPIAQRWTGEVRERIYSSRVRATRLLVEGLGRLATPPEVLLSASGINYYPATEFGAALDEEAGPGGDFLSRVCLHWEQEAFKAERIGTRVRVLRTAVVLSPEGGALARLLPVFRAGAGGRIASGRQPFPWVSIDDYVSICRHLLFRSTASGAFNVVSPGRVTNAEFVRTLARVLKRPCVLPVPRTAIRLAFGEMGSKTLVEGVDAVPAALLGDGFRFRHSNLEGALAHLLDR